MYEAPPLFRHDESENFRSLEIQARFFGECLEQISEQDDPTRYKTGPLLHEFYPVLEEVEKELKSINPEFTFAHLFPTGYLTSEVVRQISNESHNNQACLNEVAIQRIQKLQHLAADRLIGQMADQHIPDGVLTIPRYTKQTNMLSCSTACFRMVAADLIGWMPEEASITRHLLEKYSSHLVDDNVYTRIYATPSFRDLSDKKITVIDISGADLDCIRILAEKMRSRSDVESVYGAVNLASLRHDNNEITRGWHKVMLLKADGGKVTCHDPSARGGPFTESSYEDFLTRWAVTYNRAQLTIVRDLDR